MTIYNLGSINVDYFYDVPHLPAEGETITADLHRTGLGGKGANQSVAAAKADSEVVHIGAVGTGGRWTVERLRGYGVDVANVAEVDGPTAHAVITVGPGGENTIVVCSGANAGQTEARILTALTPATKADTLMLQNETTCQVEAAKAAHERGMRVIYSAAPFSVEAVKAVLPYVSILVLNEVEASQLSGAPDVAELIITRGEKGASWQVKDGETVTLPAFKVEALDTAGAGDCFIGSVAASLDQGMTREEALRFASGAAALQVTLPGTSEAMPDRDAVLAFIDT